MRIPALILTSCFVLAACGEPPAPPAAEGTATDWAASPWVLPSRSGSAQPHLASADEGRALLLTWVNSVPGRRNALRFATMGDNGRWTSEARTVVVGDSLMANWADVPHVVAANDGALWVQWLQKAGGAGHASDISLSRSVDGGFNWAAPVRVNDDDVVAEHGFASLWAAGPEQVGIAWLDGRNNTGEDGSTELRAAVFDRSLARSGEVVVDPMACDCCQTDLAVTAKGPLLLYRDRSEGEIRDIAAVRYENGNWTAPVPVHADGWHMTACPINGPSVAARGNDAIAAWFTAANDQPRVLLARSGDAGDTWSEAVELDAGEAVQGRVDVALDEAQAWVLWVREDKDGQSLWLSRRSADLADELQRLRITRLQGRGKATGFPQLALHHGNAYVVWTDIVDGVPQLHGAVVTRPAQG